MLTSLRARNAALWARLRARIRDDWPKAAKAWSTWVAAAGAAIFGVITQFPSIAAEAWSALPADLRQLLPHRTDLAGVLFTLILVLRFLRQGKSHG